VLVIGVLLSLLLLLLWFHWLGSPHYHLYCVMSFACIQ